MGDLADAIDHDHDKLVEVIETWLQTLPFTLWSTYDLGETDDVEAAAEWLARQFELVDSFARYEYEWDEDNDVEDRVRPTAESSEDSGLDSWDAQLQWA